MMKVITNYLKNGVLMLTMALAMLTLQACTHKPTITEADTYLQVRAEQIRQESIRKQLVAAKPQLTQIMPELLNYEKEFPPSRLSELTTFLLENDCTDKQLSQQVKENCYRVTRVMLINKTRELDQTSVTLYVGQRTVTQLVETINSLIDSLGPEKQ